MQKTIDLFTASGARVGLVLVPSFAAAHALVRRLAPVYPDKISLTRRRLEFADGRVLAVGSYRTEKDYWKFLGHRYDFIMLMDGVEAEPLLALNYRAEVHYHENKA